MSQRYIIRSILLSTYDTILESQNALNDYMSIDGESRPTKNSNGEYISNDIESIINFYKWFNNSKTVDDKQRPMVYYHISSNRFNIFRPSVFGKMGSGIYFTSMLDDLRQHNKYDSSVVYSCYLKIENPLEIENPFSKRNEDNDGIIAFKGQRGEEIKVYDSRQVKSIENDGTWDADDDNIYS